MSMNWTLLVNSSLSNDSSSSVTGGGSVTSGANPQDSSPVANHTLAYVLVPLGSLLLVALLAALVVFIFRKSRLDKLRHHLMPLYSFEPGDEADWESELLEDHDDHTLNSESPNTPVYSPKLKFKSNRRDNMH